MTKIGYTTGVFDLFHIGHLNVIRSARLECDHLIVGVTTDELCLQEKQIAPIIPFIERVAIVQSIRWVDAVVPQVSYDKLEAWHILKFNMVFVGSDWQGTDRWTEIERKMKAVGVIVRYLPYTKHTSSTELRRALEAMRPPVPDN